MRGVRTMKKVVCTRGVKYVKGVRRVIDVRDIHVRGEGHVRCKRYRWCMVQRIT